MPLPTQIGEGKVSRMRSYHIQRTHLGVVVVGWLHIGVNIVRDGQTGDVRQVEILVPYRRIRVVEVLRNHLLEKLEDIR